MNNEDLFQKDLIKIAPKLNLRARKKTGAWFDKNKVKNLTLLYDAEDLLQNTLKRMWEKRETFKDIDMKDEKLRQTNLLRWGTTIMNNRNTDDVRKKTRDKKYIDPYKYIDHSDSKDVGDKEAGKEVNPNAVPLVKYRVDDELNIEQDNLEAEQGKKSIHKVLDLVGIKCKEILLLRESGYTYNELSELLSIPIGTVENRLFRCKKKFHEIAQKNLVGEDDEV